MEKEISHIRAKNISSEEIIKIRNQLQIKSQQIQFIETKILKNYIAHLGLDAKQGKYFKSLRNKKQSKFQCGINANIQFGQFQQLIDKKDGSSTKQFQESFFFSYVFRFVNTAWNDTSFLIYISLQSVFVIPLRNQPSQKKSQFVQIITKSTNQSVAFRARTVVAFCPVSFKLILIPCYHKQCIHQQDNVIYMDYYQVSKENYLCNFCNKILKKQDLGIDLDMMWIMAKYLNPYSVKIHRQHDKWQAQYPDESFLLRQIQKSKQLELKSLKQIIQKSKQIDQQNKKQLVDLHNNLNSEESRNKFINKIEQLNKAGQISNLYEQISRKYFENKKFKSYLYNESMVSIYNYKKQIYDFFTNKNIQLGSKKYKKHNKFTNEDIKHQFQLDKSILIPINCIFCKNPTKYFCLYEFAISKLYQGATCKLCKSYIKGIKPINFVLINIDLLYFENDIPLILFNIPKPVIIPNDPKQIQRFFEPMQLSQNSIIEIPNKKTRHNFFYNKKCVRNQILQINREIQKVNVYHCFNLQNKKCGECMNLWKDQKQSFYSVQKTLNKLYNLVQHEQDVYFIINRQENFFSTKFPCSWENLNTYIYDQDQEIGKTMINDPVRFMACKRCIKKIASLKEIIDGDSYSCMCQHPLTVKTKLSINIAKDDKVQINYAKLQIDKMNQIQQKIFKIRSVKPQIDQQYVPITAVVSSRAFPSLFDKK